MPTVSGITLHNKIPQQRLKTSRATIKLLLLYHVRNTDQTKPNQPKFFKSEVSKFLKQLKMNTNRDTASTLP